MNPILIIVSIFVSVFLGYARGMIEGESKQVTPAMIIEATKKCFPSTFEGLSPSGTFICKSGLEGKLEGEK